MSIAHDLLQFIRCYCLEASIFLQKGAPGFSMFPKLHLLHHIWFELDRQIKTPGCLWVLSPLCEVCPIDEDFVGQCATITRHCSPRLNSLRSLQRYLAQINMSWRSWKRKHALMGMEGVVGFAWFCIFMSLCLFIKVLFLCILLSFCLF